MGRFWMRRNDSGVLLEECPAFPEALGNDVTARETCARRLTRGGVGESVEGQEDLKRWDDGSLTTSSERNNRALLILLFRLRRTMMSLPTPSRPVVSDALPLLGRDGRPIPSVVGGGDSRMEDGEDDLVVNRRSSSEILADASPESVIENTAGARGGVASNAAAPRGNVAPITAAPKGKKALIAATSRDIVSSLWIQVSRWQRNSAWLFARSMIDL